MIKRSDRTRRALGLAAAVAGAVTDVGYLRLIADQGTGIDGRVAFFASFVALMTALALVGAIGTGRSGDRAQLALLGSAAGFLCSGFIALFSIGAALMLAGALALMALGPLQVRGRHAAAAIAGPIVLLAAGLALT
jgi:hypothetical protein